MSGSGHPQTTATGGSYNMSPLRPVKRNGERQPEVSRLQCDTGRPDTDAEGNDK